jgi:hypothetical protein
MKFLLRTKEINMATTFNTLGINSNIINGLKTRNKCTYRNSRKSTSISNGK